MARVVDGDLPLAYWDVREPREFVTGRDVVTMVMTILNENFVQIHI